MRAVWICLFSLLNLSTALSDEFHLRFVRDLPRKIQGLEWNEGTEANQPTLQVRQSIQPEQGPYFVVLRGRYTGKDKILYKEMEVSLNQDGGFALEVEIDGNQTEIFLRSVGITGKIKTEIDSLFFDEWEKLKETRSSKGSGIFRFGSARMNILLLRNFSGTLWSVMPAWTPFYEKPKFRVHASLGFMPMKNLETRYFLGFEGAVMSAFQLFGNYWLEALTGMQYWSDQSISAPILGINAIYLFKNKILIGLDQIFLGYSYYLSPNNITGELRFGMGFQF